MPQIDETQSSFLYIPKYIRYPTSRWGATTQVAKSIYLIQFLPWSCSVLPHLVIYVLTRVRGIYHFSLLGARIPVQVPLVSLSVGDNPLSPGSFLRTVLEHQVVLYHSTFQGPHFRLPLIMGPYGLKACPYHYTPNHSVTKLLHSWSVKDTGCKVYRVYMKKIHYSLFWSIIQLTWKNFRPRSDNLFPQPGIQ